MRHRSRRTILALALGLASAPAAWTQASAPLPAGSRIRVQTGAPDTVRTTTGELTVWESDTIALRTRAGEERRIPLASVTRMDVSRGKGVVLSHVLIGAGAGTLTGMLVGGAIGYDSCRDCFVSSLTTITGAVVGASIGLAAGALVGAAIKGERWSRVALDRPAMGVVPIRGGMAVGFSVRF